MLYNTVECTLKEDISKCEPFVYDWLLLWLIICCFGLYLDLGLLGAYLLAVHVYFAQVTYDLNYLSSSCVLICA